MGKKEETWYINTVNTSGKRQVQHSNRINYKNNKKKKKNATLPQQLVLFKTILWKWTWVVLLVLTRSEKSCILPGSRLVVLHCYQRLGFNWQHYFLSEQDSEENNAEMKKNCEMQRITRHAPLYKSTMTHAKYWCCVKAIIKTWTHVKQEAFCDAFSSCNCSQSGDRALEPTNEQPKIITNPAIG